MSTGERAPVSTSDFELTRLPPLSRSDVNREEPLRDDRERQLAMWPDAKVLVVDRRSRVLTRSGGDKLVYHDPHEFGDVPPTGAVLLGEYQGRAYWAIRSASTRSAEADSTWRVWEGGTGRGEQLLDLRGIGARLSDTEAGLLVCAVGLLYWHDHAGFCANCGAATVPVRAGWARDCTDCRRQEYPRTDPAVIVLVHDGADRVLLGRQPSWPEGRYSVLAGFVEAGEPLEGTVAREVVEEVGVHVRDIHYLGSQPWPFPRSLMLGFAAIADPEEPVTPAAGEIENARWIHRDEVVAALDGHDGQGMFGLPGGSSIALTMLEAWARA